MTSTAAIPSDLRGLVARHRGRLSRLALVSFVGGLLEALFLVLITSVAISLVGERPSVGPVLGQSMAVGPTLLVGAVVLVFRLVLNLVGVWISASLSADVTADQRHILSHSYLRAAWAIQQAEPAGRLQELLTTFVQRINATVSTLAQAITALLSLIAFLGAGLVIDPGSTLAVLLALALVGAILTPLRRRIRQRASGYARAGLNFAKAVSELGSLGLEMQTFGVQSHISQRIDDLTNETTETQRRVQVLTQSLSPVYVALAYAAVLAGVGLLTIVGFGNLAVIGAVMLLMVRSLSYGQQLATAAGTLSANAPFLEQVRASIDLYECTPASAGLILPTAITPLEARKIEFAYTLERPALRSLSFRIESGEVVGVIGPSGAGKSTLAQLLLGLREPSNGTLEVCGIPMAEVAREWWTSRVAFVAQDARLMTGTVAENIRFFREGISDSALNIAAARANILKDLEALPHGFNSHLGERGAQLSGGQQQRLSIARALAGAPELLILDEPTSALDGTSEALIRKTLTELKGHVTVVIIAHRMSSLEMCDRIMVIEGGLLTAFDSPDVLQQTNTFYQESMAAAGIT